MAVVLVDRRPARVLSGGLPTFLIPDRELGAVAGDRNRLA